MIPHRVDVVIVNFKSKDYLVACLNSIYGDSNGPGVRIFVEDNNSGEELTDITRDFQGITVTLNRENLGFARAANQGIRKGTAPYVILVNPDTLIVDGFFEKALAYMDKRPGIGILGPKVMNADGSVQGSARRFPTPFTGLFGRSSMLTRYLPNNPLTRENILTSRSDGGTPIEVDWVSGACMVARRKAMEAVGPLDERFFMYWEDADWCRRMRDKGWKVVYFPQASVVHYVGVSSDKALSRSILEFHKSSYRLFDKYSKPYYLFLKPLTIASLSLRLCFVLASNGIRVWCKNGGFALRLREEALIVEKEKKIRILRMIARLNIGGPAIHVHLLTKGLDSKKFKHTLIAGKVSKTEGDMSYLFDSIDHKPILFPELQREISLSKDVRAFRRIFKTLRREKPDIVHTHTSKAGSSARLAVFLYNLISRKQIYTVHTFHGHVFEGYFSRMKSLILVCIERLLAIFTDVIIAISNTQKRDLASRFHIAPAEKIKTIELGFELGPFLSNTLLRGRFRGRFAINDGTLLIGIVGRLVPIKNHRMFFQAAKQFVEQNPGLQVQFMVVGDGELRGELQAYCRQLELADLVIFCGWVKDVHLVYADLDILALTSLNEGTPVSIIEAMASSVPVIATDAGGVLDLLGSPDGIPSPDGFIVCERGILCRKNEASGFSKGLKYLVDIDAISKHRLLTKARSFVNERFSEERLIRDIESLYLDLMANRR